MAAKQNTVAARLSDELLSRFNACIAAEVAARPRVDKLDEFSQGIALTGDAGKVAHWMGHEGDSGTIHRHYRGLATKADAERFFALRP